METANNNKKKKVYNYVIVSRMHNDPAKNAEQEMFDTDTGADERETEMKRKLKHFSKAEMDKLDLSSVQMDNEHGESKNIGHVVKSWAGKGGWYGLHVIRGDTEDGRNTQREISENRKREISMNHKYGLWKLRDTGDYVSEKEVVEVSVVEKGARPDCHMLMGIPVEAGSEADKILQGEIMCSQKASGQAQTAESGEQEALRIANLIARLQNSSTNENADGLQSFRDPSIVSPSPPADEPVFTEKDFLPMSSTEAAPAGTSPATATTTADQPPKPFVNKEEIAKLAEEDRQKLFSKQTPESAQALAAKTPAPATRAAPPLAASDLVKDLQDAPKEKHLEVIARLAAKLDEKDADLEEFQRQKKLRLAKGQASLKEDIKKTMDMYTLLGVEAPENIGTCAVEAANAIKDNPTALQPLLVGSQKMSAKIIELHKNYQAANAELAQLKAAAERQNRAQALTSSITTNGAGAPSASRSVMASVLYNNTPVNTSNLMFDDLAGAPPAQQQQQQQPHASEATGRRPATTPAAVPAASQQPTPDTSGQPQVAAGNAAFSREQQYKAVLAHNPYVAQAQQRGVNARLSVNNVGMANDVLRALQNREFTSIKVQGQGNLSRF